MTEKAWSLHPGDRSEEFYQILPKIIDSVNQNEFPEEQRGHFDLRLSDRNISIKLLKPKYLLALFLLIFAVSVLYLQSLKAPWVDECYSYYGVWHDNFSEFYSSDSTGINFLSPTLFSIQFLPSTHFPNINRTTQNTKPSFYYHWNFSLFFAYEENLW